MIYFINIIDVSEEGGVYKWYFIHPDTPEPLREKLEKSKELAGGFIYGIINAFGGEIIGDRVRELRLSEVKAIFMKLDHKDTTYYVFFIVDIRDNPSAVKKIFMKFYRKYYEEFDKILMKPDEYIEERLRIAMAQFLTQYVRRRKTFGARDTTHMLLSYIVSLAITGLLASFVWLYNRLSHLMEIDPMRFAMLSFFVIFILPAIPIGFLTQYKKNAIIVAYLNSLSIVIGVALLWRDMLRSGAASILGKPPESIVILGAAGLVGIMLGTVLAFLSMIVASLFECSRLTSLRPLKLIPEPLIAKKAEQFKPSKVPEAPSIDVESLSQMGEEEEKKASEREIESQSIDAKSLDIE